MTEFTIGRRVRSPLFGEGNIVLIDQFEDLEEFLVLFDNEDDELHNNIGTHPDMRCRWYGTDRLSEGNRFFIEVIGPKVRKVTGFGKFIRRCEESPEHTRRIENV